MCALLELWGAGVLLAEEEERAAMQSHRSALSPAQAEDLRLGTVVRSLRKAATPPTPALSSPRSDQLGNGTAEL